MGLWFINLIKDKTTPTAKQQRKLQSVRATLQTELSDDQKKKE